MESRVLVETLLKMGEILPPDIKEEMKEKYPEAWALFQNSLEEKNESSSSASERETKEHTDYLEQRVDQLLTQNEHQNEEISKLAGQIKTLRQTVRMLADIVGKLRQDEVKKTGEIKLLNDKVERLEADFESWKQTERHSLAECLKALEEYPASQNENVNTLMLFFLKMFRTVSEEEHERLDRLGKKEPVPPVQFNKPVYEVSGNERVNIGKQD